MTRRDIPHSSRAQQGAALAIALILLVVMTLLGLSSVRTMAQQGKMASHAVDRSLVYQYAEAALREGEAQAQIQAAALNNSFPTDQYVRDGACNAASINRCANGLCAAPDPDCEARWESPNFNSWFQYNGVAAVQSQAGNSLIGTAASGIPEYFVEILRPTGTAACTTPPGSPDFNADCNQKHPNPDDPLPCKVGLSPIFGVEQWCNYYRYRVTARVQAPGRSTVIVQSIFSVQP